MKRELRSAKLWASLVLLLGSANLPTAMANPTDGSLAGQYTSGQFTLTLQPGADGQYSGALHYNTEVFPLHGTLTNGVLQGAIDNGGGSFTAEMTQGWLDFSTGGHDYKFVVQTTGSQDQLAPANPLNNPPTPTSYTQTPDAQPNTAQPTTNFTTSSTNSVNFMDYALHDSQMNTDVMQLKIPQGWGVDGNVQWNSNAALAPGRWCVAATNLNGPELWIKYPGHAFIWRDNFSFAGLSFNLHIGDADPAYGEEIAQPISTATDAIGQVIIPRYRKDLAQATVVGSREMSPDEATTFGNRVAPELAAASQATQIQINYKGAIVRVAYSVNGRPVQEDIQLLLINYDYQTNNGLVHIWAIPYCTSFRAAEGQLDAEENSIAKPIADSITMNPDWRSRQDVVIGQANQANGDELKQLAIAQMSDVVAQLNSNIYNMTQQSFQTRMSTERSQFDQMDKTINGQADYVTSSGQTITAPITPMGETAWQNSSGGISFASGGDNPGAGYQELTQK